MYERRLPFANVQRHADDSLLRICPKKVVSTRKNYYEQIDFSGADELSSVNRSKSEHKHLQRTRNNGLKNYTTWTYAVRLFMFTWALCQSAATASDGCAPGLKTAGRTWPSGDIILEYGQPLTIYCILNGNLTHTRYRGKNATDILFYRDNTLVEPEYITVVNETTSMLHVDGVPASAYWYHCALRLDDGDIPTTDFICLNKVIVGFKPAEPKNFKCMSYNWESLVCTWEPAQNYLTTRSSLKFFFPGRPGGRAIYQCPVDQSSNSCRLNYTSDPIYRQSQPYYFFRLNISNDLGHHIVSYNFNHWANVIPAKPQRLTVVNRTSSNASLHWRIPWVLDFFPPGVHHRIMYRSKLQQPSSWKTINITSGVHRSNIYFNLTDLEYANAEYEIRVSLKSSIANGEDMWGQYSETHFRTAPTLPGQSPKADIGSFEIIGNGRGSDHRDVTIYWQPIPAYLENGYDFNYVINGIDETGHKIVQAYETTETYAKFPGISFNNVKFEITAVNCNGANQTKTIIHVPGQLKIPQKPCPFTKIAFDGGVYELSWNPPGSTDIIDYTIFFCVNNRDRPYQCTGYLDWIHVPGNTSIFNMTVPDSKKVYQFAIAANTAQGSSGMAWFSGTTILADEIGRMQSVRINRIGSNLIEVDWELEYFGRMGNVENIKIYHCPIISSYNLTCKSPKMSTDMERDLHATRKSVRNLQPSTTYMINVVVITKKGKNVCSDLFYITTLSASHEPFSSGLDSVKPSANIATVTAESAFDRNHFTDEAEAENPSDGTVDSEPTRLRKSNFDHDDCDTQLNSLRQLVSQLNDTIKSLTEEKNMLNKKLLQYNEVGLTVVR